MTKTAQLDSTHHGKLKKIALVRQIKIGKLVYEIINAYLSIPENVKLIESFDKAFYKTQEI